MSRYKELCKLAEKYSEAIDAHEERCRRIALNIINEFVLFLDCSIDEIRRVPLNYRLDPKADPVLFDRSFPLVLHSDGFWYFAFQLKIKSPSSWGCVFNTVIVGVNFVGNNSVVRSGKDFESSLDNGGFSGFFESIYTEATNLFSSPPHAAPKRIGFVNT